MDPAQSSGWSLDPSVFKEGFSPDVLLAYLARDALKPRGLALDTAGTAALAAKASLERVQLLVAELDKAHAELTLLHKDVSKRVGQLQSTVNRQDITHKDGLVELAGKGEEVRTAFRQLETRCNTASQIGLRIGDRLQTADAIRTRATELGQLLLHLQAFSQLPEPGANGRSAEDGSDFKLLPALFWEDKSLPEAAATARKLTQLTAEAHNAKQRSRMVGADDTEAAGMAGGKGSLNYTTWQLASYCAWLETRVLARFDRAVQRGSTRAMAECAGMLALFDAEATLVQRYLSALPLFAPDGEVPLVKPMAGSTTGSVEAALAPYLELCSLLQAVVQEQVPVLAAVFGNKRAALQLLVRRIAQEKLKTAIDTLLMPSVESDSESFVSEGDHSDASGLRGRREKRGDARESGEFSATDSDTDSGQPEAKRAAARYALELKLRAAEERRVARQRARRKAQKAKAEREKRLKPIDQTDDEKTEDEADTDAQGKGGPAGRVGDPEEDGEGSDSQADDSDDGSHGQDDEDEDTEDDADGSEEGGVERQIAAALGRGSIDRAQQHAEREVERKAKGLARWLKTQTPPVLHARLSLLVQVYSQTMAVAARMEAACVASGVASVDMAPMREQLFATVLANYPYPELQWLDLSYQRAVAALPTAVIQPEFTSRVMAWHLEALQRVAVLSGGNQAVVAMHTRMLFHGAGPFDNMPGCMLEQLATHITDGVDMSLDLCDIHHPEAQAQRELAEHEAAQAAAATAAAAAAAEAALRAAKSSKKGTRPAPIAPAPAPPTRIPHAAAADQAHHYVQTKVLPVLQSVHGAVQVMAALQAFYAAEVVPRVAYQLTELSTCNGGMLLLGKAVEESCTTVLQKLVDAVTIQVEKTLMKEQQRTDFWPPPDGAATPLALGANTPACTLVTAQLAAVQRSAADALQGANATSFLQEVGTRVHAVLLNHMQQFCYNAGGALRWKADVAAYVGTIRSWGLSELSPLYDSLQALANVLLVPAGSLMGLVTAQLRLDPREALRYIRLREDFLTAQVDGRSLTELFSAGASSFQAVLSQTGSTGGAAASRRV